ncbi:MAG: hypothetical protein AB8B56_09500 [Crocinitomicaceae bacterium]
MKTVFIAVISTLMLSTSFAQQVEGTEVGFDGYFGASTNGGSFTIGAKYGLKFNENFIAGPSVRWQRNWNNNAFTGIQGSYNVFGFGGFAHGRFGNVLFAGAEFELMRSPFSLSTVGGGPTWSPSLFIGGGYSQEFNESFRINAGVMYDVIDHVNSPFRQGYFMRNANNVLIPLIYRIAFFFVLT